MTSEISRKLLLTISQNELAKALLSTGDSILAEASPYDDIFGIKRSSDDAATVAPEKWPGRNLLGKALMKVGDELRFPLLLILSIHPSWILLTEFSAIAAPVMISREKERIYMPENDVQVSLSPYDGNGGDSNYDIDRIIFDLDSQIDLLSSQADKLDYLVSVASGILCGMLDVLWVGDFDLSEGRSIASDKVDSFVKKAAKLMGCKDADMKSAVRFLEKAFPIPSDGNTPDFGGGLQHHLRDFAHHPTLVGLAFSLLTQFTEKAYG